LDVDVMLSMPAIVENCFSRGVATVAAIVCGLVPGSDALTVIVGKSTFGRSLTGNCRYATIPKTRMPIMTKVVITGRLMNNVVKFIDYSVGKESAATTTTPATTTDTATTTATAYPRDAEDAEVTQRRSRQGRVLKKICLKAAQGADRLPWEPSSATRRPPSACPKQSCSLRAILARPPTPLPLSASSLRPLCVLSASSALSCCRCRCPLIASRRHRL